MDYLGERALSNSFFKAAKKEVGVGGVGNPLASSPPAAQSAAKIEACDTQEKKHNGSNMIGLKRRTNSTGVVARAGVRLGHDVECI